MNTLNEYIREAAVEVLLADLLADPVVTPT
jgi:hypothetical protein